jgi:Tfp pilus assembly protein PilO
VRFDHGPQVLEQLLAVPVSELLRSDFYNLTLLPAKDGTLSMDATAKTFRYLDPEEVAAQRKAAPANKGAKK